MTLSYFPAGPESVASSRIRIYCLLNALRRRNVRTVWGHDPSADVLIVQKRVTADILAAVAEAKARGQLIVYDCDDLGPALDFWAPANLRRQMIRAADLVTTNTQGFRSALLTQHRARVVEIIPDTIDYYLQAPIAPRISARSPLRLLWFGGRRNLALLKKYAKVLRSIPRCRLRICTNLRPPPSRSLPRPREDLRAFRHRFFSFSDWKLASFPALLRSSDLSFLPHDGTPTDRAKSSNRMIASIAWGTPVVASRTPAYAATARQMKFSACLFDRPEDVPALIESLRSAAARRRYLQQALPRIWRHHAPDVVAGKLCRTLGRYLRSKRKAAGPPRPRSRT